MIFLLTTPIHWFLLYYFIFLNVFEKSLIHRILNQEEIYLFDKNKKQHLLNCHPVTHPLPLWISGKSSSPSDDNVC